MTAPTRITGHGRTPAAPPPKRSATSAAPLTNDWRNQAACRAVDPETFFPIGQGPATRVTERDAKRVCGWCPVRTECLEYALGTGQYTGVWGGLTEDERRDLVRVPESGIMRCLNRQEWIEKQIAAGVSQTRIADELGVTRSLLSGAVKRFTAERAADEQALGVSA